MTGVTFFLIVLMLVMNGEEPKIERIEIGPFDTSDTCSAVANAHMNDANILNLECIERIDI